MEKSRSRQLSATHWPFGGFKPLSQERLEKKRAAEKRLQPRKLSRFFNLLALDGTKVLSEFNSLDCYHGLCSNTRGTCCKYRSHALLSTFAFL